jgi:type I restriction-modification system DNA methylase subunit
MGQSDELASIPFDLIKQIATIIDSGEQITNRELLTLCSDAGVDGLGGDPRLCHEIAETAFNYLIGTKYGNQLLIADNPGSTCSQILRPLQQSLPTQSWRSDAQMMYQQFSTPAPIAYLAAYLMNLNASDTVLEPSCGTGSLAVWARAAGSTVVTNEIDPRRRQLAGLIGFDPTGHDAEFIDDFLPESIAPNAILINPPFSSSGGRVERNRNKFGFRHVESALRRLASGGRFAVILGEGGSPGSVSGRRFWDSMSPRIRITRSISLPGREYYRNGTTVGVTLILGRKFSLQERDGDVQWNHQSFDYIEEAFDTIGFD